MFIYKNNVNKHLTTLAAVMTSVTKEKRDYEYYTRWLKSEGKESLMYGTDGECTLESGFESVYPIAESPAHNNIHLRCLDHAKGDIVAKLKELKKYISNVTNKVSLSAFLTETWVEMAKHILPAEKELVIGGDTVDGYVALSVKNRHCHEIPALNSDHEEADTRMLLHAQHASQGAQRIIIQSPDTDVLLLCVTHYVEIGTGELWFRTGVKDRLRYIPAHKIALNLGPLICKALPAFHALTGCDSTSSLSRIGKRKARKTISNNRVHQESLACVGQSPDADKEAAKKAEAFICSLFTISNRTPATADEARYLLFCQKAQNNLLLSPTSDSLLEHIKRANYQAYVWRKALVPRQNLPSPAGHGWKIVDDTMCPELMTKPPAPASILELINCQCVTS
ncbi:hypothetical protein ACROYT_G014408 [Oculina patagonica]